VAFVDEIEAETKIVMGGDLEMRGEGCLVTVEKREERGRGG
jgi:hypothetical protein